MVIVRSNEIKNEFIENGTNFEDYRIILESE